MLLLYRYTVSVRSYPEHCIYIPLCFYFISFSTAQLCIWHKFTFHYASTLSSPLWIICKSLFSFTFHYASTLSLSFSTPRSWYSGFTFHYASTLSSHRYRVYCALCLHLHSTMLLLYRSLRASLAASLRYLHSTMLLLYLSKPCRNLLSCLHLHSTMLLLYHICLQKIRWLTRNLHSTMLLLYHRRSCIRMGNQFHLHSTMLLLYPHVHCPPDRILRIYIPLCFYFIRALCPEKHTD